MLNALGWHASVMVPWCSNAGVPPLAACLLLVQLNFTETTLCGDQMADVSQLDQTPLARPPINSCMTYAASLSLCKHLQLPSAVPA
jgi:hypothetical protein